MHNFDALSAAKVDSELTAIVDFDFLVGPVAAISAIVLNGIEDFKAINNLAKDDVLAVKMGRINEGQEELRSIRVLT